MERKTKIRIYDTPIGSPTTPGLETTPESTNVFNSVVSPVKKQLPSFKIEEMVDWTVGLSGRIKGSLGREYWSSICVLCMRPGGATLACDQSKANC